MISYLKVTLVITQGPHVGREFQVEDTIEDLERHEGHFETLYGAALTRTLKRAGYFDE